MPSTELELQTAGFITTEKHASTYRGTENNCCKFRRWKLSPSSEHFDKKLQFLSAFYVVLSKVFHDEILLEKISKTNSNDFLKICSVYFQGGVFRWVVSYQPFLRYLLFSYKACLKNKKCSLQRFISYGKCITTSLDKIFIDSNENNKGKCHAEARACVRYNQKQNWILFLFY